MIKTEELDLDQIFPPVSNCSHKRFLEGHLEWLGFVQPVGLVVSIPALTQAQAYVNKNIIPDHQRFLACLSEDETADRRILDFPAFTRSVLGWEAADLLGTPEGGFVPDSLEVALPEYGETLNTPAGGEVR